MTYTLTTDGRFVIDTELEEAKVMAGLYAVGDDMVVQPGGATTYTVHKVRMAGPRRDGLEEHRYDAYVPSSLMGRHHNITALGTGRWFGEVGSERPPADIDALPAMSDERSRAVRAWYESKRQEAIRAIRAAFPECDFHEPVGSTLYTLSTDPTYSETRTVTLAG